LMMCYYGPEVAEKPWRYPEPVVFDFGRENWDGQRIGFDGKLCQGKFNNRQEMLIPRFDEPPQFIAPSILLTATSSVVGSTPWLRRGGRTQSRIWVTICRVARWTILFGILQILSQHSGDFWGGRTYWQTDSNWHNVKWGYANMGWRHSAIEPRIKHFHSPTRISLDILRNRVRRINLFGWTDWIEAIFFRFLRYCWLVFHKIEVIEWVK
jgi:hypothetical protein